MQATASIIIRPKQALIKVFEGTELDDTPFVREPQLWTYEEGDRIAWTRQEFYSGVKLLFLMNLRYQFLSDAEWKTLGNPPISIDTFDQYWDLNCFHGSDYQVEETCFSMMSKKITVPENGFLKSLVEKWKRS